MRLLKQTVLFLALLSFFSCGKPVIEKPEVLVKENEMINILVDIHLAESAFNARRHRDSMVMKSSSAEFYHSILNKHQVPDSVFERSYVFYAGQPKRLERMYRQVLNKLNEMEQEFSGRKAELQEVDVSN